MHFDPNLTLFLLFTGLAGLSLGVVLVVCPRCLPIPATARFLCGLSLAPHAIGLVVLLLFATFPGVAWAQVQVTVLLLSTWGMVAGRAGVAWLVRRLRRAIVRPGALREALPAVAITLVLVVVVSKMAVNAAAPLIAFDALQYAREALQLGSQRDISAWVGHTGNGSGTLRGDIHHPIFPAYLAWSQQFSGAGQPGHASDLALRWAFQVSFIGLILALPICGLSMRWRAWSAATMAIVLVVPQFAIISDSATRDAFRLVPLVTILVLLLRLGVMPVRSGKALQTLPAVALGCMLAMMSHTLNGVVLVLTMAGWVCWMAWLSRWRTVVFGVTAAVCGLVMGGWTYADAFFATGSIHGSGVLMYGALGDSPMLDVLRRLEVADLRGVDTLAGRVREMLLRDGRGFAVIGLVVAAGILFIGVRDRKTACTPLFGAAMVALFVALPVVGMFDLGSYKVSEWLVTNQRYLLHWYIFLMVPILGALRMLERLPHQGIRRWFRVASVPAICAICYLFTLSGWYQNRWDDQFVSDRVEPIRRVSEVIHPGRLVLEDARWNYYLDNHHVVMYSTPTRVLFAATTSEEFEQAFRALDAGGVVLKVSSLDSWWRHGRLLPYLEQHGCRRDIGTTGLVIYSLRSAHRQRICP